MPSTANPNGRPRQTYCSMKPARALKLNLNEEEETDEALSVLAETVNTESQV